MVTIGRRLGLWRRRHLKDSPNNSRRLLAGVLPSRVEDQARWGRLTDGDVGRDCDRRDWLLSGILWPCVHNRPQWRGLGHRDVERTPE